MPARRPSINRGSKGVSINDAWLNANELSALAGRAHYNREGERVNAEQDKENMVTLVLRAYAEKRGLQYADWA